ncbi:hypothetical protein [Actinacidiphila glaucinigra]|uniref:hypothetical protein n=1 Tax=Actinacidiphila glaucinigra TaxID=235986 RepID=UPI00366C2561
MFAGTVLLSEMIPLAVGVAMKGGLSMPEWELSAGFFGWMVVTGFVATSRLKGLGDIPLFEAAVPIADPATVLSASVLARARRSFGRRYGALLVGTGVVSTVIALFEPAGAVVACFFAIEPLMRAERAARWERRHGVLLWQVWEHRVEQEQQPVDIGPAPVFTSARQGAPRVGLNP